MKTQIIKISSLTLVLLLSLLNSYAIEYKTNTTPRSNIILSTLEVSFSIDETIQINTILNEDDELKGEPSLIIEETIEEDLTIEAWITNDELFRVKSIKDQKEETLEIEEWMTDSRSWKL